MTNGKDAKAAVHTGRVKDVDRFVGERLRSKRLMLGLSQQTLGEAVGVAIQQIQKYERGINRISCGSLYHFAQLLKEPITYFYEGLSAVTNKVGAGMAESQDAFKDKDAVHERQGMSLLRSYNKITDTSIRKKILDIVKMWST